jgi:GT2 family glycosyltransferase
VIPTTSVVVPSFARPALLHACLTAVARQKQLPDQVIVSARRGDGKTAEVASERFPFEVKLVTVDDPGHIPPLVAGVAAARGEIIFFSDDDAEPEPGWIETLSARYRDPTVGGVGGLVIQPGFEDGVVTKRVGRISPVGRFDKAQLHRVPAEWEARDVDVLRGTNMSFRRSLLERYPWDMRLNRGAATDYEVTLCAWIRAKGYRVVYDPNASVIHTLGPRPEIGRTATATAIRDYSHNLVYVSATALPPWQRPIAVAAAFLVGSRQSHGLATALADTLAGRPPSLRGQLMPALAGKLEGLRSSAAWARSGPLTSNAPAIHTA